MGIGPGGSDLSQFFENKDKFNGMGIKKIGKSTSGLPYTTKPQTAGAFGSLLMDPNEFS